MATSAEIISQIEKNESEINSMTKQLNADQAQLKLYEEQRRDARGGSTGRISSSDYELKLKLAKYDVCIQACKTKIALSKSQIKLRKEEISALKKELKTIGGNATN